MHKCRTFEEINKVIQQDKENLRQELEKCIQYLVSADTTKRYWEDESVFKVGPQKIAAVIKLFKSLVINHVIQPIITGIENDTSLKNLFEQYIINYVAEQVKDNWQQVGAALAELHLTQNNSAILFSFINDEYLKRDVFKYFQKLDFARLKSIFRWNSDYYNAQDHSNLIAPLILLEGQLERRDQLNCREVNANLKKEFEKEITEHLTKQENILSGIAQKYLDAVIANKELPKSYLSYSKDRSRILKLAIVSQGKLWNDEKKSWLLKQVAITQWHQLIISTLTGEELFSFSLNEGLKFNNQNDIVYNEAEQAQFKQLWNVHLVDRVHDKVDYEMDSANLFDIDARLKRKLNPYIEYFTDEKYPQSSFNYISLNRYSFISLTEFDSKYFEYFLSQVTKKAKRRGELVFENDFHDKKVIKLDIEFIKVIKRFFEEQKKLNPQFIFPFNKIKITLHDLISTNLSDQEIFADLLDFIKSLDQLKLETFNFGFSSINAKPFSSVQIENLKTAFSFSTVNTKITFNHCQIPLDSLLEIESVLELRRQKKEIQTLTRLASELQFLDQTKVKDDAQEMEDELPSHYFLTDEIILPKMVAKPSFQRQHERAREVRQEIQVQQAWQIDSKLEKLKQSVTQTEQHAELNDVKLIKRADIKATLENKNKDWRDWSPVATDPGKLLTNYEYRGQDLLGLWDSIVGDETWQQLCGDGSRLAKSYQRITAIDKNALIHMVTHAHDFRYGMYMSELPSNFAFTVKTTNQGTEGILYFNKKNQRDVVLAPSMHAPSRLEALTAQNRHIIKNLPCNQLFESIKQYFSLSDQHETWHLFAENIDALYYLNQESVSWIIKQIQGSAPWTVLVFIFEAFRFHIKMNSLYSSFRNSGYDAFEEYIDHLNNDWLRDRKYILNVSFYDLYNQIWELVKKNYITYSNWDHAKNNSDTNPLYKNINAHTQVLLKYGVEGSEILENIFDKIRAKHGATWFTEFERKFVGPLYNLNELLTPEALHAFQYLLSLNEVELHWWDTLTKQHMEHSGYARFSDLMNGFKFFLDECDKLNIRNLLPKKCPLTDVRHLKVGLRRLLTILQNTLSAEEQLQYLEGLDLTENGAVYASQHEHYFLVTKEMHFTPQSEIQLKALGKGSLYSSDYQMDELSNDLFVDQIKYLRRIGKTAYRHPYEVHLEILKQVLKFKLPANTILTRAYNLIDTAIYPDQEGYLDVSQNSAKPEDIVVLKSRFLDVLLQATTGRRNMTSLPSTPEKRAKLVKQFLTAILKISQHTDEKLTTKDGLIPISLDYFKIITKEFFNNSSDLATFNLQELTKLFELIYNTEHPFNTKGRTPAIAPCILSAVNFHLSYVNTDKDLLSLSRAMYRYYQNYFEQALQNFQFNSTSDYNHYVSLIVEIRSSSLSKTNQGLFCRLLSLVKLKPKEELDKVELLFTQLLDSLLKRSKKPNFDRFMIFFSSLVPRNRTQSLLFEDLNQLVTVEDLESALKLPAFSHLEIKKNEADFVDPKFFASAKELEVNAGDGIGSVYSEIKTLFFSHYINSNAMYDWDDFILLLIQIGMRLSKSQSAITVYKSVTAALIKANWVNCSLAMVSSILSVFDKQLSRYKYFPDSLVSAIHVDILHDENYPQFEKFLEQILGTPNEKIPVAIKAKLINVASRASTGQALFDCLIQLSGLNVILLEPILDLLVDEKISKSKKEITRYAFLMARLVFLVKQNKERKFVLRDLFEKFSETPTFLKILSDGNFADLDTLRIIARTPIVDEDDLRLIIDYLSELETPELKQLTSLYKVKPYPAATLTPLIEGSLTLPQFCDKAICDPHNQRDQNTLKQQFNTVIARQDIEKIEYQTLNNEKVPKLQKHHASLLQQNSWYGQLDAINTCGLEKIRNMPMHVINELMQNPKTDYLTRIAIAREVLYRTREAENPIWPNHLQTLAILCQQDPKLNKTPIFFEIASGAGKSVVEALSAAQKNHAVVILKHQRSYAYRDAVAFKSFYEALGKPVTIINAESTLKDFDSQGVHYAEISAFSLFCQNVEIETGRSLFEMFDISYFLDEGDDSLLHNTMAFNLTFALGEMSNESEYAWLFQFLMNYVKNYVLPKADGPGDKITIKASHLINELKQYHAEYTKLIETTEFQLQLRDWLVQAWQAYHLQKYESFVIKEIDLEEEGETFNQPFAATIIKDMWMPMEVTYTGVVHQCLHARLQNDENLPLIIPTVKSIYSTHTVKSLMDSILRTGKSVIVLSATPGSEEERAELAVLYGLTIVKIPSQASRIKEIPPLFCQDNKEQLDNIVLPCVHYTHESRIPEKRHSLVLPVDSIEIAERQYHALSQQINPNQIIMVHANNSSLSDEEITALERKSAEPGKITIVTSGIIERGFDPQPKSEEKHKVITIITSITSISKYEQQKNRSGRFMRNGKRRKGRVLEIYDLGLECQRYPELQIDRELAFQHPEQFKHLLYHAHYRRESSYRIQMQLEGETVKAIQKHFFDLWHDLLNFAKANRLSESEGFKNECKEILNAWSHCLTTIMQDYPSLRLANNTISAEQLNHFTNIALRKFSNYLKGIKLPNEISRELPTDSLEKMISARQDKITLAVAAGNNVGRETVPFKVYSKWDRRLGYSQAFLDSGKQPLLQRLVDPVIHRFKQREEYLDLVEKNVIDARAKALALADSKWRIMPKVRAVDELAIIREKGERQIIQEGNAHYKVELTTTNVTFKDNTQITFNYDPFNLDFSLTIESQDLEKFSKFEAILQKVFRAAGLKKLPLENVSQSDDQIVLRLNFSKVTHLDLAKLFSNVAEQLCQDDLLKSRLKRVIHWAYKQAVPQEQAMLNVLRDLRKLLNANPWLNTHGVYRKMMAYLNFAYLDRPRDDIFYYVFLPIVKLARQYQQEDIPILQAIANYNKGNMLIAEFALPLPFSNLKQLLENQHKRSPDTDLAALIEELPETDNVEKEDDPTIPQLANLQDTKSYNQLLSAKMVLKSLKYIAHQGLSSKTAAELLMAKKTRAIVLVQSALQSAHDIKEVLPYVELVNSKHDDKFNPYAYIRQEEGALRFSYGNTETWEVIIGMIKAKLVTLDKSSLNAKEIIDYCKIMNTHRKHTYGFGWLFKPERYCEKVEIQESSSEELHM